MTITFYGLIKAFHKKKKYGFKVSHVLLQSENEIAYSSSSLINAKFTYHLGDLDAFKQSQNQMPPQARRVTKLHRQGAQRGSEGLPGAKEHQPCYFRRNFNSRFLWESYKMFNFIT